MTRLFLISMLLLVAVNALPMQNEGDESPPLNEKASSSGIRPSPFSGGTSAFHSPPTSVLESVDAKSWHEYLADLNAEDDEPLVDTPKKFLEPFPEDVSTQLGKDEPLNAEPTLRIDETKSKILVLDLDETMINANDLRGPRVPEGAKVFTFSGNREMVFFERPDLIPFLEKLAEKFNLVLWTAGKREYADGILKAAGIDHFFPKENRLYRDACFAPGVLNIKDLRQLGYSLKKIVAVDDNQHAFLDNEATINGKSVFTNGVLIDKMVYAGGEDQSKYTKENDELLKFLLPLAEPDVDDVRPAIAKRAYDAEPLALI